MSAIFVVEDDQRIRSTVVRELSDRGHSVRAAGTAMEALREVVDWAPEVVVLDLGLPDVDGSELLKMLRAVSAVPVVVATARDDESEIVRLLDAGADDYIVKPYSVDHLEARVRAVLRRSNETAIQPIIEVGDLCIDEGRRVATLGDEPLELSRKEFDLLSYLARRKGQVVARRELLAEVWRQPYGGGDKTVDVHVSWLRRKLGESAAEPRYLHTVRGVGLKLVEPEP
ncbi:MAG TPA: response regulator transcription factor [Acidimicrobiales bacterium]|nr:response regulator transcription factor [Acidimicrobiales bacterium]